MEIENEHPRRRITALMMLGLVFATLFSGTAGSAGSSETTTWNAGNFSCTIPIGLTACTGNSAWPTPLAATPCSGCALATLTTTPAGPIQTVANSHFFLDSVIPNPGYCDKTNAILYSTSSGVYSSISTCFVPAGWTLAYPFAGDTLFCSFVAQYSFTSAAITPSVTFRLEDTTTGNPLASQTYTIDENLLNQRNTVSLTFKGILPSATDFVDIQAAITAGTGTFRIPGGLSEFHCSDLTPLPGHEWMDFPAAITELFGELGQHWIPVDWTSVSQIGFSVNCISPSNTSGATLELQWSGDVGTTWNNLTSTNAIDPAQCFIGNQPFVYVTPPPGALVKTTLLRIAGFGGGGLGDYPIFNDPIVIAKTPQTPTFSIQILSATATSIQVQVRTSIAVASATTISWRVEAWICKAGGNGPC